MSENNKSLLQNIRSNPLPWFVQIVGVVVISANIWIAYKLAPIAKDLAILQSEVKAVEVEGIELRSEYEATTAGLEGKIEGLSEFIVETRESIVRIETDISWIKQNLE